MCSQKNQDIKITLQTYRSPAENIYVELLFNEKKRTCKVLEVYDAKGRINIEKSNEVSKMSLVFELLKFLNK